jgi:hypothetical protein
VDVHILGGDATPDRHLYLPAKTCLKDIRKELGDLPESVLRTQTGDEVALFSCTDAVTVCDHESDYQRRLVNIREPFARFAGNA